MTYRVTAVSESGHVATGVFTTERDASIAVLVAIVDYGYQSENVTVEREA